MSKSAKKIDKCQHFEKLVSNDVTIGKDVLELVSTGMYVNPLDIYREYVQNSIDSIEEAVERQNLESMAQGRVEFSIDRANRSVRITDNGVGQGRMTFVESLASVGFSSKKGTQARGFRGIGRLAGLGYCQELVFRSKSDEDRTALEISWDCRRLKKILMDASYQGDLSSAISEVVTLSSLDRPDDGEHFFEVEMRKVVRLRNDPLLKEAAIRSYLSQVAPVPFDPDFKFGREISERLFGDTKRPEISILVGNEKSRVVRSFRNTFQKSQTESASFERLEFFEVPSINGELAAVGWILHHGYMGALPGNSEIRGLRARVGNIQVGDFELFRDCFPEERFNSWCVGEIHVLDSRIRPNGRRDNFEENIHYSNLMAHVVPRVREVARICRASSKTRIRVRDFQSLKQRVIEGHSLLEQGALSTIGRESIVREVRGRLADMARLLSTDLSQLENGRDFEEEFNEVMKRAQEFLEIEGTMDDNGPRNTADVLARFPRQKQEAYSELFDLIVECSSNRLNAKLLIDKMLSRLELSVPSGSSLANNESS